MATKITQLAKLITENTTLIEQHLASKNEPEPSFTINAPKKLNTTDEAEVARMKAISAANELSDLLKGPAELIRYDWTRNSSLRLLLRFDIPKLVPVGEEMNFSAIAAKTKLPERDVKRILRHAMCQHYFHEPRKGFVAHTALSQLLAEDEQQQAIASTVVDVLTPALMTTADAVAANPGSEEAEEAGFSAYFKPGKSMWETFSENPEMGRKFGVFIGEAGANESLLEGVEWSGRIVDIGGSHGDAMVDVLRRHPGVEKAVVQDLGNVIMAGKERMPRDLGDRLVLQEHDFFKPQTESADIFFLRWIFHNWSNKYSVNIIRNLIPVMKPGTKIVVNDFMLPEPNTLPPPLEKAIRNIDMTMLGLLNATERDAQGWHELFREADPRFKVTDIKMTPPGLMAIVVVEWQG